MDMISLTRPSHFSACSIEKVGIGPRNEATYYPFHFLFQVMSGAAGSEEAIYLVKVSLPYYFIVSMC